MGNLNEKLLESKTLFEGRVLKLNFDTVLLPNGKQATREVIEHPGAVAIVPILDDGRVVLVRQYRHAAGTTLLEIPAGKLNLGEDRDTCAARELREETGYIAKKMRKLASVYTTPGFTNEIIDIYVAEGLTFLEQELDDDEFISLEYYTKEQLMIMIKDKKLCDAKTLVGLLLAVP